MPRRDTVFMTMEEVRRFIHRYKLSRNQFNSSTSILAQLIKDLDQEAKDYEVIEKKAYDLFGVTSIKELQDKVDEVNRSGLLQFSNEYIQKSGTALSRSLGEDTTNNIFLGMEKYLFSDETLKPILENIINNASDTVIDEALDQIINKLSLEIKSNKKDKRRKGIDTKSEDRGLRPAVKDIIHFIQDHKTIDSIKLTDAYRKHFTLLLGKKVSDKGKSTWNLSYDPNDEVIDELETVIPFSYYPYYCLTEKQEKEARNLSTKKSRLVWEQFVEHLVTVAGIKDDPRAYQVLDWLTPSAFIKKDYNGVKGILGEVQMLFIAIKLTNKKVQILGSGPLANLKTKNKAELGTDVLLNSTLGIQVKNYTMHNSVYQLSKTGLSWDYIQSKIGRSDNTLIAIGNFYSTYSYNIPTTEKKFKTESFSEYQNMYKNAFATKGNSLWSSTQSFFAANLDKFLTLSEAYDVVFSGVTDSEKHELMDRRYDNAFYFFGGKTLIPTSYILRLLSQRIQIVLQALFQEEKTSGLEAFYMTSSYTGQVWPHPEGDWLAQSIGKTAKYGRGGRNLMHLPIKSSYTINQVLNDISFNMRLNLKLEDLNLENGGPLRKLII